MWDLIKIPVYFNALGVDPGKGVPEICRRRFKTFLDTLMEQENVLVTVRNDGAKINLLNHLGKEYSDGVLQMPDNGFFADFKNTGTIDLFSSTKLRTILAINLASDMPSIRFNKFDEGEWAL